jgi:hypothetical protein
MAASPGAPLLPGRNRRRSAALLLRNWCRNCPLRSRFCALNHSMKKAPINASPPTSDSTRGSDRHRCASTGAAAAVELARMALRYRAG